MADWQIEKPAGVCFGTQKEIEPGQDYIATLIEAEDGLQRRDFSLEYWQQQNPQVYCFWKSRMAVSDEKKQLFIDDDMLMAFFERLAEETDPEKLNFRFVVALILMRKRILKYDSSQTQDGRDVWKLRIAGSKDIVDVVHPNLTEDQIEQLSGQLSQILQVDLET